MDLHYACRAAALAEQTRALIRRRGHVNGHPLWEPWEDQRLREWYPNYDALGRILLRRTYYAIRHRARALGLTPKRYIWTAPKVSLLRRMYPTASVAELKAAFPTLSYATIKYKAKHTKLYKRKRPLKPTGTPSIDDIRARAFEFRISMADLDELANTRRYFQKAGWHNTISERAIFRATAALDGVMRPQWKSD